MTPLLAVDLSRAKIADKREDTKQATISCRLPAVLQPRVDHSVGRRMWSVDVLAVAALAATKMPSATP